MVANSAYRPRINSIALERKGLLLTIVINELNLKPSRGWVHLSKELSVELGYKPFRLNKDGCGKNFDEVIKRSP